MKTYQTKRANIFFGGKGDSLDSFKKPLKNSLEISPTNSTINAPNALTNQTRSLIFGHQVHESALIEVNNSFINSNMHSSLCLIESSDGLYTEEKNLALGLYTADCVPCFVVTQNYIYSLHLGWKGVYFGLLKKCLDKIKKDITSNDLDDLDDLDDLNKNSSNNSNETASINSKEKDSKNAIEVFIGPHILYPSFEVQIDLIDKFSQIYPNKKLWSKNVNKKFYISLIELIKLDLKLSGLEYTFYFEEKDTFLSQDHYSYRSDDKTRLRNLSCAFLRP
jgi:copper oxidase (laccase) domain-containing protein